MVCCNLQDACSVSRAYLPAIISRRLGAEGASLHKSKSPCGARELLGALTRPSAGRSTRLVRSWSCSLLALPMISFLLPSTAHGQNPSSYRASVLQKGWLNV